MNDKSAAEQIDDIIKTYGGWKGDTLSRLRAAVMSADRDVVEEVKWKMPSRPEGLPVWSHDGIVCLAETFKDNIKLVFVKGAQMEELHKHFNARLNSRTDRAIEFREGDHIDVVAIQTIVNEAIRLNVIKAGKRAV